MVKSFAQQSEGAWLKKQLQSALRNAAHDFNGASDPLYARRIDDQRKSEAARRSKQVGGETPSKPQPVLKPESQRGRTSYTPPTPQGLSSPVPRVNPPQLPQQTSTSSERETHMPFNESNAWLAAHYWRAMSKVPPKAPQAKPEHSFEPLKGQDRPDDSSPNRRPSQSPSQSI